MHQKVERILFTEAQIKARAKELGEKISRDYAGKTPLLIGILRGSVMFFADVVKNISTGCTVDFMCLKSYCGTCSTGDVRTLLDVQGSVQGRHIIIVEDIVDTGLTLSSVKKIFETRRAASFEICAMLDKPANRKTEVSVKYAGFKIGNEFVVGYGLDYNELYRNLPYIGVYKQ